jgi:hypothetical protein
MLEDGGERFNRFERNLGASIRGVKTLIRPDESDNTPSVFWITNPDNSWRDNVASGSSSSGFWIELRSEVRVPTRGRWLPDSYDPSTVPLLVFVNNVAHSNKVCCERSLCLPSTHCRGRHHTLTSSAPLPLKSQGWAQELPGVRLRARHASTFRRPARGTSELPQLGPGPLLQELGLRRGRWRAVRRQQGRARLALALVARGRHAHPGPHAAVRRPGDLHTVRCHC